jgi:ABC-type transport system involved in cytochrome bd biosynthesis fused ATPase/permease subunit
VGDTARLKSDLKGILVHSAQSALLFVAVCAVLLAMSPLMGAFFLLGGALTCVIGWTTARRLARLAGKERRNEGAYAESIRRSLEQGVPLRTDSGARREVRVTRLVTASSLAVHALLGATVAAAAYAGVTEVQRGAMAPGELFLFVAYALTVHRRLVQFGRQIARFGKVKASLERLAPLLEPPGSAPTGLPLASGLRLEDVKLRSTHGHGARARLKRVNLEIRAGSRVAILGGVGDGKSSLLRSLAGVEPPSSGSIRWDDVDGVPAASVGFLPELPVFPPQRVWQLLGLSGPEELGADDRTTLEQIGAWKIIARLPRGLQHKVASPALSSHEARALGLAEILFGRTAMWVLDAPLEGNPDADSARLRAILRQSQGRTLVVSSVRESDADLFDQVVVLRRGKVRFQGTPSEWRAKQALIPAPEPAAQVRVTPERLTM